MKATAAFIVTALLAVTAQAQAACTGSVASGITLVVGTPQSFTPRALSGCVQLAPASLTFSGSGLGSIFSESNNGATIILSGLAAGSGSMIISGSGFSPLTVPITVTMGSLDLTQP